jgi:septal ring factor EnvC (AmiA/AmiB activator)
MDRYHLLKMSPEDALVLDEFKDKKIKELKKELKASNKKIFKDKKIKELKKELKASNKRVAELEIILLEIEQKIQNALPVSNM